jgi:serine/threonine protein kinase
VLQGVIADSQPPVDATLESVRTQFPELEIHELIGVGGMGRVYRARDPLVDRIVALKILSPERVLDPEWVERFTREARALARLNHPHIVQVHRFGSSPQPHLVMEYVDGVNLRQAMEAGGLSAREALVIVPKLCDALHYAHEHGVLHRDIKPENILIDSEGRVKIVDFGLAKLRDEGVLHFTLTQSGAKLGTLAYMAPEQVENPSDVDHRADLYSLGVVFYEMLTGELPLGRFPSPSEANGTDPRLDAVVLRTLEKKREKRFPDAGAMRTEIESAATGPVPVKAENWNELNYEYRSPIEWRG